MISTHLGYRVTSLCQFWVISVIWSDVRPGPGGWEWVSVRVSGEVGAGGWSALSVGRHRDRGGHASTAWSHCLLSGDKTRNKTQTKSRWELILKIRTTGHWKVRFYLTVFVSMFWSQHKSAPIKLFRSVKCFMFCARGLEHETNLTFLDYISYLSSI